MALSKRYCFDCGARLVYFDNLSITKTSNEQRVLVYGCVKCSQKKAKPTFLNIMKIKTCCFLVDVEHRIEYNFRCFMRFLNSVNSNRFFKIPKDNNYMKEKRRLDKYLVLSHYSNGKPSCNCCGITDMTFLTMDHIHGRKLMNHNKLLSGHGLYRWIINNFFQKGFQCLCFNCNIAKGIFGKCNHEKVIPMNQVRVL